MRLSTKNLSLFTVLCVLCVFVVPMVQAMPPQTPEELLSQIQKLEIEFVELGIRANTLNEYKPEDYPDFKDLQKASQFMELLDFNKRRSELLINQYNILEDKLLPLIRKSAAENPQMPDTLMAKLNQYTGRIKDDPNSIFTLQEKLNRIFLRMERLEKNLKRLQDSSRNKEVAEDQKQRAREIKQSHTLALKISRLDEETKLYKSEIASLDQKLEELTKKETKSSSKVQEIKKEIANFKQKSKSGTRIDRQINRTLARVNQIRLNGLEIPRLNAVKTSIYLNKVKRKNLADRVADISRDISAARKERQKELWLKALKALIVVLIALFVVFIVIRIARRIVKKVVGTIEESESIDAHRKQRYQTLSSVVLSFVKAAVWAMAVLWILSALEIDYGPFLVAAGGISLAIAFGAQSLVKDIVTGFFILMEEQFALGDGVEICGISGSVEKISLRTVKIRSLDGALHTIPNGTISKVTNKTYQWSRLVVKVSASYNDDPKKVLAVLNRVAGEMYTDDEWKDCFIGEPNAQGILSFGDSAINYRIIAKTVTGAQWGLSRAMMIRIKEAFDKEGIDIPYNYVNVNMIEK